MNISVIIPCHNSAPWVKRAIRSVSEQKYAAFEIIVVDDNSTDSSIDEVLSSGVEVRLLKRAFGNAAMARNAGIEIAKGDWCAFLDADSTWHPHHLSQAVELLSKSDDSAYMSWQVGALNDDGSLGASIVSLPVAHPINDLTQMDFLSWRYAAAYGFPTVGLIARTDAIREENGFDVTQIRRHDMDLFMRLVVGRTWAFHPNPSWTTKPCEPTDISGNTAACQYFVLRGYAKNAVLYNHPFMDKLLKKQAHKAMVAAIRSRRWSQVIETWKLSRQYLSSRKKLYVWLAGAFPARTTYVVTRFLAAISLRKWRELG